MVRVQLHHPVITAINLKDRYKIIRRVQNDYVLNPPFFILTSFNYAKIPAEYPRIPNINNPRIIQSGDTCFRISQTQINVSTTGARTSMLEFANWPIRWPPDIWLNQPEIETSQLQPIWQQSHPSWKHQYWGGIPNIFNNARIE